MSTSATTSQLGRQFWAAIRESANSFAGRLPGRQNPLTSVGLGHASWRPLQGQSTRWYTRPSQSRIPNKNVRQSCTSGGGLLLLGLSPSTPSTSSVVTTCTTVADSTFCGSAAQRAKLSHLARQIWFTSFQHTSQTGARVAGRRAASSNAKGDGDKNTTPASPEKVGKGDTEGQHRSPDHVPESHLSDESLANSVSKYLHLPKMPHRPTKEELLAAASGFGERLKVRFKWFSIRSMRPWNADEWGAFVSWFLFGHLVWVLVGTTTFFSLIILFINTVLAQGMLQCMVFKCLRD